MTFFWRTSEQPAISEMTTLTDEHPVVVDRKTCAACEHTLKGGDRIALVVLGPGQDLAERDKARRDGPYNAVCALVHWSCATGEP